MNPYYNYNHVVTATYSIDTRHHFLLPKNWCDTLISLLPACSYLFKAIMYNILYAFKYINTYIYWCNLGIHVDRVYLLKKNLYRLTHIHVFRLFSQRYANYTSMPFNFVAIRKMWQIMLSLYLFASIYKLESENLLINAYIYTTELAIYIMVYLDLVCMCWRNKYTSDTLQVLMPCYRSLFTFCVKF